DGAFRSLFDLVDRIDLRVAGRRTLEALITAGACDSLSPAATCGAANRAQLLAGLEGAFREAQLRASEREAGQGSLFDALGGGPDPAPELRPEPVLPDVEPWSEAERLAREKEILGFFISGHPLEKFREEVRLFDHVNTGNLRDFRDQKVELACVVTAIDRPISRRTGGEWGRLPVEDFHGTATALAFGEVWERYRHTLAQDSAVLLVGTVSGRDRDEDAPPLFLDEVHPLEGIRDSGLVGLELSLLPGDPESVAKATLAFRASPGPAPIFVEWRPPPGREGNGKSGREGGSRFRSRSIKVTPSDGLLEELRSLFGMEHVRLVKL